MTTRISVLAAAVVLAVSQPLAASDAGQDPAPPPVAAPGLNSSTTVSAVPEAKTWILIGIGLGFTLFRMSAYSRRLKRFGGR